MSNYVINSQLKSVMTYSKLLKRLVMLACRKNNVVKILYTTN